MDRQIEEIAWPPRGHLEVWTRPKNRRKAFPHSYLRISGEIEKLKKRPNVAAQLALFPGNLRAKQARCGKSREKRPLSHEPGPKSHPIAGRTIALAHPDADR